MIMQANLSQKQVYGKVRWLGRKGAEFVDINLHSYQEFAQWDRFSAVLCCLLGLVFLLDFADQRVRKHFVSWSTREP
jgi:hypothetical protein